jgi:DNA uptake protein ComE-like DNA-binding protein
MKRSLVIAFFLTACTAEIDPTAAPSQYAVSLSAADAQRVLDLVNYPANDAAWLDNTVGLDSRAAKNIVTARNGADGVSPSADDVYFTTTAQLDAVPYVGDAAFTKLAAYAASNPAPAGETVETVVFQGWESQSVVWGVNQAEAAELFALLDDRAARSLELARPFKTVAEMGPLAYVGTTALKQLHGAALGWWNKKAGAQSLAGRFDGAIFTEAEAETALQIVNQATQAQLTAHGMTSTAAKAIIAARPYTNLAQVSAVSGVGQATMNALLAYAQSGQWGASCVSTFDDAVGPHLADLLFLSESDRPLDLVSFPGAGGSAPTAASLAALVGASADSQLFTRSADDFFANLEQASSTADPTAAATVQAAFGAQLTDVTYIAIQPPASSINHAEVDVYLVGRTSCGDLVGIHAISIET